MIYEVSLPDGVLNFALNQTDGTYKIGLTISIAQVYKKVKSEFIDASLNGKDHLRSREMKYRASILINGHDIWHSWNDGDTDQFKPLNFNTDIVIPEKEISAYLNSNTIKQILKCNFEIAHPGFYITFDGQEYTFLVVNKKPDGLLQNSVDNENVSLIFNNLTTPVENSMTENNWIVANQATQQFVIPVRYGESSGFIRHKYIGFGNLEYNPNHKRLVQRDTLTRRLFAFERINRYYNVPQTRYDSTFLVYTRDGWDNATQTLPTRYYDSTNDWFYNYSYDGWYTVSCYVEKGKQGAVYRYNKRTLGPMINYTSSATYNLYLYKVPEADVSWPNNGSYCYFFSDWTYENAYEAGYTSSTWVDAGVTVKASGHADVTGTGARYYRYYYEGSSTITYSYLVGEVYEPAHTNSVYGEYVAEYYRADYAEGRYVVRYTTGPHDAWDYYTFGSMRVRYELKTIGRTTGTKRADIDWSIDKPNYQTFTDWYIDSNNQIKYESKTLNEITNYSTLNTYKYSL